MHTPISQVLRQTYAGKRVLVTGHTGFKGAWLALWLKELGAEVFGVALPPTSELGIFRASRLDERMTSTLADLRAPTDLQRAYDQAAPDVVFHLAAQAIVGTSYQDPLATFDANVMGTARVLDCARKKPGARAIVVVTSDKCYENAESLWGHREGDPLGGDDPYSASKAGTELVAASYRASFFSRGRGPQLATARAGNVIGGGDWGEYRLVPDCIRALRDNQPIALRNPRFTRPWQHVLDALAGYLLLGTKLLGSEGERYASAWNFGPQGPARTVEDAARGFVREWGTGELQQIQPDLFAEKRTLKLDPTKALELLGWRTALDFDGVIRWTVSWYKAQHETADSDMHAFSREQITKFERELDLTIAPVFNSSVERV